MDGWMEGVEAIAAGASAAAAPGLFSCLVCAS